MALQKGKDAAYLVNRELTRLSDIRFGFGRALAVAELEADKAAFGEDKESAIKSVEALKDLLNNLQQADEFIKTKVL